MANADRDKLYKVAFYTAYGKSAREGWFWRAFSVFDSHLREIETRIKADYREVRKKRDVSFSDFLDLMHRQAEARWQGAVVEKFIGDVVDSGQKVLHIVISADEGQFEDAVASGMSTIYQLLSDNQTAAAGRTEYGQYEFNVSGANTENQ